QPVREDVTMGDHESRGVWLADALTIETPLADRYTALVEQIPAVVYVDVPDAVDTTLYVSPQIESMLGIAPERYVNDAANLWHDCLHPADRASVIAEYETLLAAGAGSRSTAWCGPTTGRKCGSRTSSGCSAKAARSSFRD
ncbi:MAG TPA: PAS domain-containing protein, partial [Actinomycetes bacterium]|nr:PAS domain-containing protein [Actinomycetes bacterium]